MASIQTNRNKRGEIISYRIRCCLGRDSSYRQIMRGTTFPRPEGLTPAKERKEIERLAAEWEKEEREAYKRGAPRKRGRTTLVTFIRRHWMPDHVEDGRHSANGREFFQYTSGIICEYFGDRAKLAEIDPETVKRFLKWLRVERGYSEATQQHVYHTLVNILGYAVRCEYIDRNPTDRLGISDKPKVPARSIDFLTVDEARVFLSVLDGEPLFWRVFYSLLLFTGLRRGEALGVRWGDYDAKARTLTISRNVTPDKSSDTKVSIGPTKTGQTRIVPVADALADLLEERRQDVIEKYGEISPEWFIFGREGDPDRPLYPTTPTTWLRRFERRKGLREVSCHDLRHSAASLSLEAGADLKQIQTLLGHADAATTLRFYTGIEQERTRRAVEGIEALISGKAQEPDS